ncbi:MAG TPA: GNAT family N-acetyltransferase [Acidobacteriota bacterium]|nr:GNAT family N-acetyltransferase [Acidobacteriota bacterium]
MTNHPPAPIPDGLSDLNIRPLDATSVEDLLFLWRAAELDHRPRGRDSADELRREMDDDPGLFIGAFAGQRLVGSILATDDGRRGWINRLAVHPEFRRRGLAEKLIDAAEERIRRRGIRIIAALVMESNHPSRRVFEARGYTSMPDVLYYSKRDNPDV